jgi:organic hydroperoxide reductase OsmC/OhrA
MEGIGLDCYSFFWLPSNSFIFTGYLVVLQTTQIKSMSFKHLFNAALFWRKENQRYTKSHSISISGKADLAVSAAKAFKGDPTLLNPEDLLLSSLMSCHMMSYLYICSQHQIEVLAYADNATATLITEPNGAGRFTEVQLNPVVTIANKQQIDLANSLHLQANQLCFIANSCNFPIHHQASCKSL